MSSDFFNVNVDYESNNTLEFELFRRVILEKALTDFKSKPYNLQYNEFFSIENITQFELFPKLRSLGSVYSCRPNSFIIDRKNSYVNISVISRENKKILNCAIYAADETAIRTTLKDIRSNFNIVKDSNINVNVRWYYAQADGRVDYTTIPETLNDIILPASYPYIENLELFIEQYLQSTEPILVLVGTSGSGKTRLLRHIVSEIAKNISKKKRKDMIPSLLRSDPYDIDEDENAPTFSYTNDVKAIKDDEIFVDFLSDGTISGLIMEDMDDTLKPRQDGNDVMSKLLSASDGFISNYNKKMLVTSNISNVNTIDAAFLRPGRCFDIVKTRKLTEDETVELLKVLAPDKWKSIEIVRGAEYSLAEVYKLSKSEKVERKVKFMGFNSGG